MAIRRLAGYLVAATLMVAGATGCDSASSSQPAGPPASSPRAGAAEQVPAAQLTAAAQGALMVFDDYERTGSAVKAGTAKKADPGGVAQYFADQGVAAKFQGSGGIGAPLGCGVAKDKNVVDGAVVGTPVASPAAITIPVSLYIGTKQAAQVSVTADPASGKLKDFACGPVAAPALPGVQALVGYYGGVVSAGAAGGADKNGAAGSDDAPNPALDQLKQQFLSPAFAQWKWSGLRADPTTCGEDGISYWHAVYAPTGTTTGGAQWYFWPADAHVNMSVAVDAAANRVAWVYCPGELTPRPAPATYSDEQIQGYVGDLFNSYAYLRALQPAGADPSVVKAYFTSPEAYKTAADSTGPQPLECSPTAAGSIGADSVTVSGASATVTLTSAPTPHPVEAGETALGHPKVTLDLATMKIASVSCG